MRCEHDWREALILKELDRPLYYGLEGEPMCSECWQALFSDTKARRIAETTIGEVWISTVWLGLDHAYLGGPPLIFETMVFSGALDQEDTWRYSTREQALEGHQRVVELVRLELAATDPASTDPRVVNNG
jgi:hypothetical protein